MRKIRSISVKIMGTVLVAILITSILNSIVTTSSVKKDYQNMISHYVEDTVHGYGSLMGEFVDEFGEDTYSNEEVKKSLGNIHIYDLESSYAYVVSTDGIMLYHPTAEKIGQPVENEVVTGIVADLKAGKSHELDVVEYEFNGATKYAGSYVDEENGFIFIITADKGELLAVLDSMQIRQVFVGLLGIILGVVVAAIIINGSVTKPVAKLTHVIQKMGTLDFTENPEVKELNLKQDEVGLMSHNLETLREEMNTVVTMLKQESNALHNAADMLNHDSEETATNVGQIEIAVQEIATGATSQAEETQSATENVIIMGNMIEETNQDVEALKENANEMRQAGEAAIETLEVLNEINQKARTSINIIGEQTNTTNVSAVKIREATTLITSIAEETNLLSLNASIEAARAGEQGRGFAVVASQIQKLAEQSNDSARQIEAIISVLIADSEKAVTTMNEVIEIMETQSDNVNRTEETFAHVKDGIDKSLEGVEHIANRTSQLDSARENVVDVVQNLTAIAEENAAGTEETSASVTEMSNIVQSISESALELYQVSKRLDEEIQKFKV